MVLKRWYTENELKYSDIDIISKRKWKLLSLVWHGLSSPWNSPGLNTGVGSLSLIQGIFPTQGSNPGFSPCSWILYKLRHQGGTRILEWIVYPFSSRSSQPRNRTGVSCIAGRFFTSWATKEALKEKTNKIKIISYKILNCILGISEKRWSSRLSGFSWQNHGNINLERGSNQFELVISLLGEVLYLPKMKWIHIVKLICFVLSYITQFSWIV